MKHYWIGLVVLVFALGCGKSKKNKSSSGSTSGSSSGSSFSFGSSSSPEKLCTELMGRKYARPRYDKRWKEKPDKMAKKKARKIKRCTEALSRRKSEQPERYKRFTRCVTGTSTYDAFKDCADIVEREAEEASATAALKGERKWFDVPTLGVKLNAPASYTLELSDGRAHLKGPGGLLFLGVETCGTLGMYKESGGGPQHHFGNPESWCARGEAAVRQIAKGRAEAAKDKVGRVEALTNGTEGVLVETVPEHVRNDNDHNLIVYLAREKDAVTCHALLDDHKNTEAKLAREVCSSMRPL